MQLPNCKHSTEFLARAHSSYSPQHIRGDPFVVNFLKGVFIENWYGPEQLEQIISTYQPPQLDIKPDEDTPEKPSPQISLPWVPDLSERLRKHFKEILCN